MGAAVAALSASLAACGGGDDSSDTAPGEKSASYPVRIVNTEFPPEQRLGETARLFIGVENAGEKPLPGLTMTLSIADEEGRESGLAFAIRDPQPGLAQPDRPVWVLSEDYPRANGGSERFGAETANLKTYNFGPLEPGGVIDALWQVSAVRAGDYKLVYEIGAGLGGKSKAETLNGKPAKGHIDVTISDEPPDTEVTDSGEVVEIDAQGNSSR